jgi:hypothetical protein
MNVYLLLSWPVEPDRDYSIPTVLKRRSSCCVPLLSHGVQVVAPVDEYARTWHAIPLVVEIRLAGHVRAGSGLSGIGKPIPCSV